MEGKVIYMYTRTGWGVMSCNSGLRFQCGSTMKGQSATFTSMHNEEQIISGCPIDDAISVRVDGGFGSYRWFVYITMLLLRDASSILILHCGPPEPPQRHLYC